MLILAAMVALTAPHQGSECSGTTSLEIDACLNETLRQASADMERYLAAAARRAANDGGRTLAQSMERSQRAWILYRDRECNAVFDFWSGGTSRIAADRLCAIRLTRHRTHDIWANWLMFVDRTPPLLPEPGVEQAGEAR
ncbi:lysozyme inhibitor LprI family protein [Sphingomonas sp. DT-51]|uniref:lysozyme inhibitor LprI family protein n=1 Tax=Sphingomonas sp. DT-51 TaxID=3396165 RepID=UPI003F1C8B16